MTKTFHYKIDREKWESFSKKEQLLNIASELCRIYRGELEEKDNLEMTKDSYERGLELIDFTLNDPKWKDCSELYQLRDSISALYLGKTNPVIVKFFYNWLVNLSENL